MSVRGYATEADPSVGRTVLRESQVLPQGGIPGQPESRSRPWPKVLPSIRALKETVDLAVIVTPAASRNHALIARPGCAMREMTQGLGQPAWAPASDVLSSRAFSWRAPWHSACSPAV